MANYRVLVSDPISEKGVDALRNAEGITVDVNTGLKPEALLEIIGEYHGLVVRSQTKVTPQVFAAAKNLKVIGRAGVGVDNIDRNAATDHGVVVMNTPSGNTISTAEHAFTLMLSLARNIPQAHASIIAGKWDRKSFEGVELNGKRLAILGMGRIGTEFAKRAQAFGMTVVAYDPYLTAARAQSLKVELAKDAMKHSQARMSSPCTCRSHRKPNTSSTTPACAFSIRGRSSSTAPAAAWWTRRRPMRC